MNDLNVNKDYPLKWFHFLIYFGLFFAALVNVANGLLYMTGAAYGSSRDTVYSTFPV